jgi:hypothetical protein
MDLRRLHFGRSLSGTRLAREGRSLAATNGLGLVLVLAGGAVTGCRGCKNEHPYVPYTIEAGAEAAGDAGGGGALEPDAGAGTFHPREAIAATPGATRVTVDGLDLAAPVDRVFVLTLTGDFDGDGARDAAAIVARSTPADLDAGLQAGELLLYRGGAGAAVGAPSVVATPPPLPIAPVAPGVACTAVNRLGQVGRHTLAVEMGAACDKARGARWVAAVVVGRAEANAHFKATLIDPPNAPSLAIEMDGADRDGDGLDDLTLRASLEGGAPPFEPGPRVSALVRWFDRPAGMSRDPDEPDASLRAFAAAQNARAAKAKDAISVPRAVEQARALYRALCVEGGSPRVLDLVGGARALPCGSSKGLEEAGLAEVRAYATTGDPLRAIAAFDRAQVAPATRTAARVNDAQGWITQAAPVAPAPTVLRVVGAVPAIERGAGPAWAALAFEPSGKLLVRTVSGVVRVDPVQGDEAAADDVQPWRSGVVSPDGAWRWIEAYDACDGVSLHATFAPSGPGEPLDVPLPIAPPLGTRCEHAGARGAPATTLPVAWDPRGLWAVVAGEQILFSADLSRATPLLAPVDLTVTLGGPRSPSGRVVVTPTSMGLFVRGTRGRLLRAKELEGGWLELRDCVVSDDAARVACVRGGRAFVGVWAAE